MTIDENSCKLGNSPFSFVQPDTQQELLMVFPGMNRTQARVYEASRMQGFLGPKNNERKMRLAVKGTYKKISDRRPASSNVKKTNSNFASNLI